MEYESDQLPYGARLAPTDALALSFLFLVLLLFGRGRRFGQREEVIFPVVHDGRVSKFARVAVRRKARGGMPGVAGSTTKQRDLLFDSMHTASTLKSIHAQTQTHIRIAFELNLQDRLDFSR